MKYACPALIAATLLVQGCGRDAPPAGTSAPRSGEATYQEACAACHDAGVAGAPKLGDAKAWEPRLEHGMEALYAAGLNGKPGTAMVAKGGQAALSDAEVRAAVDYMASRARPAPR
jgi:cytochrome c5